MRAPRRRPSPKMPRPCQGRPPCCSQPSWAPVQGDRPVARGALGKALLSPTVPRSLALALAATVRTATRAACRPERCRHTAWRPGGAGAASRPWRQRITAIASGDGRWRSAPRPSPPHPGYTGAPSDKPPPLWPPARPASACRPLARVWPLAPSPSTDAPGHHGGASLRRGCTTYRGTLRLDGSRLPGERASAAEIVSLCSPCSVAPVVKLSSCTGAYPDDHIKED